MNMKKLFKYSILATLLVAMTGLTACQNEELDTDQYSGKLALAAIAPNPVMRGGQLRIIGANLEKVSEVRFAGGASVTAIETVASGSRSEIRVTVPMEGAEVGPVTVVTNDGLTASTRFNLEYTEPIVINSFSPAQVLSGDVLTIRGEYLNNVREVILGGVYVTTFNSQSRTELTLTVPGDAVTGYVIVGDVNELEDQTTIPNQIYSDSELVVGDPTVAVADTTTYKSGDLITVTGEHLDMIETVDLVGASDVDFTVAPGAKSITFNLPPSATDGNITLTSFAGKAFDAGFINSLSVADLGIKSLAEDGRYKAGSTVEISGSDLDLVNKVDFTNAEAMWYYQDGKIYAVVPDGANDGGVGVTLASGKQAWTDPIEVVKPSATGISGTEAVAGKQELSVSGTDLDLVTGVTIGDKVNGLIPCDFYVADAGTVVVTVPSSAYSGVITLTAASGYQTETERVTVSYDEAISVTFDQPTYTLGRNITISGNNLMKVESIVIKGKKVVQYDTRADNAMSFALPEGMGPGIYRLDFTLIDGTQLTWAVPFEVTAPYTETFIWEGSRDTDNYANNLELGTEDDWVNAGLAVGDVVRVYFTPADPSDWSMQLFTGHWAGMSMLFPGMDNPNQFNQNRNPDAAAQGYVAFEVTDEIFNLFTEKQWWGSALIVQGKFLNVTGISFLHFGATETVVWEGTSAHTGDYATNLELGGEDDWVNAELWEGAEVRIYFTPDDASDWSIQVFDGHWGGMGYVTPNGVQFNQDNSPEAVEKGYVSFKAEGNAFAAMTSHQWWGFALIVQGKNLVVTKLAYI